MITARDKDYEVIRDANMPKQDMEKIEEEVRSVVNSIVGARDVGDVEDGTQQLLSLIKEERRKVIEEIERKMYNNQKTTGFFPEGEMVISAHDWNELKTKLAKASKL